MSLSTQLCLQKYRNIMLNPIIDTSISTSLLNLNTLYQPMSLPYPTHQNFYYKQKKC